MAQELVEFRPQVYTILPANATDERLVELWERSTWKTCSNSLTA